jgi:hypothetical protein
LFLKGPKWKNYTLEQFACNNCIGPSFHHRQCRESLVDPVHPEMGYHDRAQATIEVLGPWAASPLPAAAAPPLPCSVPAAVRHRTSMASPRERRLPPPSFRMENPFSVKVLQVFTGFGVGCGVGIGVGRPIYLGNKARRNRIGRGFIGVDSVMGYWVRICC